MATTYAPQGLLVSRPLLGFAPSYATNPYLIQSTYTSPIGFGDLVKPAAGGGAGYIAAYSAADTTSLGVFAGCQYYNTTIQQWIFSNQWPSGGAQTSGNIVAFVIDDPNVVFSIQVSGGPVTQASVGLNVELTGNGAPNSSTGLSTAAALYSSVSTTNTLPLRIVGISTRFLGGIDPLTIATGQASPAANNWIDVSLNSQFWRQTTGI